METNKNSKKIVMLGLILLIIAGLIVVALKGFQVSLLFGKHETVELNVGKEVDVKTVKEICHTVLQNQKYVVKELEVFGDSFQVNVKSMTEDEKSNLINQVNEKFETEKTVEDLNISSISNRRIRDVMKPYIVPMILVFGIVTLYTLIRFRKIQALKMVLDYIWKIALTEILLLCVIAIIRIPVNEIWINLLMIIAIAELVYFISKGEKRLENEIENDQ